MQSARRRFPTALLTAALALAVAALPAIAEAAPPLWPDLSHAPTTATGGGERDAAVLVGIDDYLAVADVPGAVDNLKDWYRWLVAAHKVPAERVSLLENVRATREEILGEVERRAKEVQRGGKLWFVFIGHGAPSKDGGDGVLVGADAQQSARSLYARSVTRLEVLRTAATGKQAHTVMVLDACFSGRSGSGGALVEGLQPLIASARLQMADRRAVVLTAGRGDEFAGPLPGLRRPAFSYLVLGGLRGWADGDGNARVTGREVVRFARSALGTVLTGRQQTPEVTGAADAGLAVGGERKPDLVAIRLQLLGASAHKRRAVTTVAEGRIGGGGGGWDPTAGAKELAVVRFVSSPPGAMVAIDGVGKCKSTPCSVEVEAGRHTVALSLEMYQPKAAEVALKNGGTVQWALEPDFAELSVVSEPAGLTVRLDDKVVGNTPIAAKRVSRGPHTVMIEDRCFATVGERIVARAGQPRTVTLKPQPRPAGLDVRAVDGEGNALVASVLVDGKLVGRTPGVFKVGVCASKLEVRGDKGGSWSKALALRDKHVERLVAKLNTAPSGFVRIPAGSFRMGSPKDEPGRDDDEGPQHQVVISRPFLLQATEVTQGQWRALMGTSPSHFESCGTSCPVEQVSWYDAVAYCNALSKKEGLPTCYVLSGCNGEAAGAGMECEAVRFSGLACRGYRLPTEAEWEYAARAGTASALYTGALRIIGKHNGPALDAIAFYGGNSGVSYHGGFDCSKWPDKQRSSSRCGTHPVGRKRANRWGLHDMLGNVWEWTWDRSGPYSGGLQRDPIGPTGGSGRVGRGCGWGDTAAGCRAAYRNRRSPSYRISDLGFRPARSVP